MIGQVVISSDLYPSITGVQNVEQGVGVDLHHFELRLLTEHVLHLKKAVN